MGTYWVVRSVFKLAVNVFYHTIDVEGLENIPENECAIICPNHGNSLTDAMVVSSVIPRMVRLTAKDTLWKKRFFNYFVKGMHTVPIQRRQEHGKSADNVNAFSALYTALSEGSLICLFPEGISRYHSSLALPLKPGVARIAVETMRKYIDRPGFKVHIIPCGITYLHREKFRSDVSVRFAKPITIDAAVCREAYGTDDPATASALPSFEVVNRLTKALQDGLVSQTISATKWEHVRLANTARCIYAHLGTQLTLSEHVRLTQTFLNMVTPDEEDQSEAKGHVKLPPHVRDLLCDYQGRLSRLGLKDERVRRPQPPAVVLLWKICLRAALCLVLFVLAIPGTLMMLPMFFISKLKERHVLRRGSLEDNLDEITQYKISVGFCMTPIMSIATLLLFSHFENARALLPGPMQHGLFITCVFAPAWLWSTIRFLEDGIASARSALSLIRLLTTTKDEFAEVQTLRSELKVHIDALAVQAGLPEDIEELVQGVKVKGGSGSHYMNPKRRRKKDWNEVMRLHDVQMVA